MSKHTPGPWSVGPTALIQDKDGQAFAGCYWDDEDVSQEVAIANARLMAAAPEMLYALKRAAINVTELLEPSGELADSATLALLHSTIAKAEGRT